MKMMLVTLLMLLSSVSYGADRQWTLEQCIDYAMSHNISLKIQRERVAQQEISLNTSRNAWLPSVSGHAGGSMGFGRALSADNTYVNRSTQNTTFNVSADIPLYTGGQITGEKKTRALDLQASLADLEKARESVTLNVISAYLEAVYQKDMVDVAERQVLLSREQLRRMQVLYANGKVPEADVVQIEATVASDDLTLTTTRNSYTMALLSLCQLLELDSPEGMTVVCPEVDHVMQMVVPDVERVFAAAVECRWVIKAERIRLEGSENNIRLAKAGYYPTLSLGAGLGSNYYRTNGFESRSFASQMKDNFSQQVSLNLAVPIFNRFTTRNGVRAAQVAYRMQQLQLDEATRGLRNEIQRAYYDALSARKQCESSEVAQRSSTAAFDLMRKKYENGKATALEYLEQKTLYMKAESAALQARYVLYFRIKILESYLSS